MKKGHRPASEGPSPPGRSTTYWRLVVRNSRNTCLLTLRDREEASEGAMNTTASKPTGCWPKAFSLDATRGQIIFDVVMGILMPIVCLVCDPVVFRRDGLFSIFVWTSDRGAPYNSLTLLGGAHFYIPIIGFGIVTFALWLLLGTRLKWGLGFVTGILLVGSLFALTIGAILLLPSAAGLATYGIGIFGFTPLFTSIVFLRNGVRMLRQANGHIDRIWLVSSLLLSITFTIAIIWYLPGILG